MNSFVMALHVIFSALKSLFTLVYIFFRFFLLAPLTATAVFLRSPRGIKKERWVAWRLARAHRMSRRLSPAKLARLEELAQKKILQEVEDVRVAAGMDKGKIVWMNTFKLAPI